MQYLVLFTTEDDGTLTVEVPDLPGCFSKGNTLNEAKANIKEAIKFHLQVMKEEGMPIPAPSHEAQVIEVTELAA
jgi:predicted RNase H-like HicB family nuclease